MFADNHGQMFLEYKFEFQNKLKTNINITFVTITEFLGYVKYFSEFLRGKNINKRLC